MQGYQMIMMMMSSDGWIPWTMHDWHPKVLDWMNWVGLRGKGGRGEV